MSFVWSASRHKDSSSRQKRLMIMIVFTTHADFDMIRTPSHQIPRSDQTLIYTIHDSAQCGNGRTGTTSWRLREWWTCITMATATRGECQLSFETHKWGRTVPFGGNKMQDKEGGKVD